MTAPSPTRPFDVCGLLPAGVTVLEASAGTGKTFTIAALATRYVAEGVVPLENLLLVTFTRMATGELRQRVRERLVSAEAGLTKVLAGIDHDPNDEVLALLATGRADDVRERRDRLRSALSDFDAATIDTTHAFCHRVLNGLGVAGDIDRDAAFIEESTELVDEVVTDFYVRKFAPRHDVTFTLDEARRIAKSVVSSPDAAIHPAATNDPERNIQRSFAINVRAEVDRRRRLAGLLTFDDLLTRLRGTLADAQRGALACRRLRDRYRVALVDEFQDTDPIQWEILRRAFVDDHADATLVLIGDPKQAVYAFRGADVYSYLDAGTVAGERATLSVNWRSDQPLLDAYDAVFAGTRLGHEGITYRNIRAATGNTGHRLRGAPVDASLRLRMLHRGDGLVKVTPKGYLNAAGARAVVAADVAADIARLLSSHAAFAGDADQEASTPVRPGHIAVLVQRNVDAMAVRDALHEVRVPAVVPGAGSVFATPAAIDWLRLLEALERPSSSNNVRAVALSGFLGWTAERMASATEADWERLHGRLHHWADVLRQRGVAALMTTISRREQLAGRVLARPGGERELTDLRHVGQLLHAEVMAEQLGLTALTAWLHTRIDDANAEASAEDRTRRLESDAEAVQVLTVFRSKGLEFPVVYCPYLWHPSWIDDKDPPVFHDPNANDQRTISVTRSPYAQAQHRLEARGEELRLAYVALTRAKHQAVVWWAPTWDSRNSSLCRILFHQDADGNVASEVREPPPDDVAEARFAQLATAAPGCISVERVGGRDGSVWNLDGTDSVELAASVFGRTLDPRWRRTSYSALTSGAHEALVASEADEPIVSDEAAPVGIAAAATGDDLATSGDQAAALRATSLPLAAMRTGPDVGTFVHGVFERCDFAADDLDASLSDAFAAQAAYRHVDVGDRAVVLAGLRAVVETPLGPLVGDIRLRDIGRRDRIDELGFELPLVGGDAPTSTLEVADIGQLLARHLEPTDVLHRYAERLHDLTLRSQLRGYLSGFLDLVVRTPDGRYAVIDYKTNRLGPPGEELTAWQYRPRCLIDAMYRSHYPLQALLYTVALHRYLRWRVNGYSPGRHLAGVLYLFVRGMIGPDTPVVNGQRCGVFSWQPPAPLVESLSDLFDTGAVTR